MWLNHGIEHDVRQATLHVCMYLKVSGSILNYPVMCKEHSTNERLRYALLPIGERNRGTPLWHLIVDDIVHLLVNECKRPKSKVVANKNSRERVWVGTGDEMVASAFRIDSDYP